MCRIMTMTNLSKVKNLEEMALKMRDLVSEGNKDGFGYALSYKNSIFAEKFINPLDFKSLAEGPGLHEKMELDIFDNNFSCSYGTQGEKPLSIIAHGRTSTNSKGYVEWSHPFVNLNDDSAFIHNGVVTVPNKHAYKGNLSTNNDSEYLANVYWHEGMKGVSSIDGYFAFMNLRMNGVVEIVKDNTASLYAAYCPALDSYIFATLETMITRFAFDLKLEITKILSVTSMMSFTIQQNKLLNKASFKKNVTKQRRLSELEKRAFKDYEGKKHGAYTQPTIVKGASIPADNGNVPSYMRDPMYYSTDSAFIDDDANWLTKNYGAINSDDE